MRLSVFFHFFYFDIYMFAKARNISLIFLLQSFPRKFSGTLILSHYNCRRFDLKKRLISGRQILGMLCNPHRLRISS